MSIHYDFYQNPPKQGAGRREKLHARVITRNTVSLNDLAELMHQTSSLTRGDVLGATTLLVDYIIMHLKNGCRVHFDGLGYFQLTLTCPPIQSASEIRAESVKVKSLSFCPDHAARKAIKGATFVRQPEKRHSKEQTAEDLDNLLTRWFAGHDSITRVEFQGLSGLTRSTANRRLQALEAAGRLCREGRVRKFPYYCPAEGCFGR